MKRWQWFVVSMICGCVYWAALNDSVPTWRGLVAWFCAISCWDCWREGLRWRAEEK